MDIANPVLSVAFTFEILPRQTANPLAPVWFRAARSGVGLPLEDEKKQFQNSVASRNESIAVVPATHVGG